MDKIVIDFLINLGLFFIVILGINLVLGLSGQLFLGYSALMNAGGFVFVALSLHYNLPWWLTVPAAAITASLIGTAIFSQLTRLPGFILAIVSLIFVPITVLCLPTSQVNYFMVTKNISGHTSLLPLTIIITITTIFFGIRFIQYSRFGRGLIAVREQEHLAELMGIGRIGYKVQALATGFFLAGLAGGFSAAAGVYTPADFGLLKTLDLLTAVIVCGLGSFTGIATGALLVTLGSEYLNVYPPLRVVIDGILISVFLLVRPTGLFGKFNLKRIVKKNLCFGKPLEKS